MNRIKTKDKVVVIAGKSKGHVGIVIKVGVNKVWVEGANLIKKHVKPNPQLEQKGGIITKEAPLHVSNVAVYNPLTSKADKVGFKIVDTAGKLTKKRFFKSNNEWVDAV